MTLTEHILQKANELARKSYVYWTVHHLDSWIKRDQLDVTCFFISLFNAQNVSDVNTSILRSLRLICWVISWVVLLWFDACWCYVVVWLWWCGILMQTTTQHQHTLNQSNTSHEITQQICRKQYTIPVCICIMYHKCTIDQQFIILFYITLPLHVSTLLRHIQGARSQYLLSYISMWMEHEAIASKHVRAV